MFGKPKGKTKAPQIGVTFNHGVHGKTFGCVACHHNGREESCFECHGAVARDKQLTAKDMIHKGACVKCHKDTVARNSASKAPTKCAACHGGGAE